MLIRLVTGLVFVVGDTSLAPSQTDRCDGALHWASCSRLGALANHKVARGSWCLNYQVSLASLLGAAGSTNPVHAQRFQREGIGADVLVRAAHLARSTR